MISMKCPHCGHQLNVDDKYAGQAGQCANCKGAITVPVPADRFEDFGVDHPETATPPPAVKARESHKPIIKKEERGPRELPLGILAVLGVVILIGAGVVVGTTIEVWNLEDGDVRSVRGGELVEQLRSRLSVVRGDAS